MIDEVIEMNQDNACWDVEGVRHIPSFIRTLEYLLPEGSLVYFEGTTIAKDVEEFLRTRQASNIAKIKERGRNK